MRYFAEIDQENIVKNVIIIDDDKVNGLNYPESEVVGKLFIEQELQLGGNWLECSLDNAFRKRYPSQGFQYNVEKDAFVPPQPFPSWTLDGESLDWVCPVERPDGPFMWNEEQQKWVTF